jgi:hypothetical protein
MQAMSERFASGGGGAWGGGGGAWGGGGGGFCGRGGDRGGNRWGGMNGGDYMGSMAEAEFKKRDQNADGTLSFNEMTESLQAERDKWDLNQDGMIDLAEYKPYFQARIQQMMGGAGREGSNGDNISAVEGRRAVVYRAGNLPKELPGWFAQLDTNQDAQVAIYEWKHSGRSFQEFDSLDRNGDGFLTVEEVLHATKSAATDRAVAGGGPPGISGGEAAFTRNSFAFNGGDAGDGSDNRMQRPRGRNKGGMQGGDGGGMGRSRNRGDGGGKGGGRRGGGNGGGNGGRRGGGNGAFGGPNRPNINLNELDDDI